ncbi:hypothetical protein [Marvinbryantia formatexigens]|uniref:hypothetical protein n=2 Tax=Marvinbryantia formatexigens TaxID=168384 RepID=UPI0002D2C8FE|nr:hypothetical protein [Marvinbryantia formatexigens]
METDRGQIMQNGENWQKDRREKRTAGRLCKTEKNGRRTGARSGPRTDYAKQKNVENDRRGARFG